MKTPGENFATSIMVVISLMLAMSALRLVEFSLALFDLSHVGGNNILDLSAVLIEAVAVIIYTGCLIFTWRSKRNSPVFIAISGLIASLSSIINDRADYTTYIGVCFCIILIMLKLLMSEEQWDDPGKIFKF